METLNQMVDQLIKENRQLKRELERLVSQGGAAVSGGGLERGLRSLQRRVQRAVSGATTSRRGRSSAASSTGTRRRTGARSSRSSRSSRTPRTTRRRSSGSSE